MYDDERVLSSCWLNIISPTLVDFLNIGTTLKRLTVGYVFIHVHSPHTQLLILYLLYLMTRGFVNISFSAIRDVN
jgi:hypothetical protein